MWLWYRRAEEDTCLTSCRPAWAFSGRLIHPALAGWAHEFRHSVTWVPPREFCQRASSLRTPDVHVDLRGPADGNRLGAMRAALGFDRDVAQALRAGLGCGSRLFRRVESSHECIQREYHEEIDGSGHQ